MDTTPFDQGVAASMDGLTASANPFPEGTEAHESWRKGYHSVIDQPEDLEPIDASDET